MFYSHFVLQKKGPLARIWLAAHWDKKLTKAQVFETNIETSVDGILKPKVKIALRTSGHLLLGVVRIYSRKAKYLLADCNEAFVKIKMAFRPGMVDLPEEHREAAANTITLPEVFHDFDPIPELNDADIEAQFSLNQSRAEEITMREDYGNLCLVTNDEGFGDMAFDNEPTDLLQNASTLDQSHLELFHHEPNHISLKEPQPSTSRAAARSLEIDTPIRGDGFGGNFGQDIVTGGLFEGGLSLFDDAPIGSEMPPPIGQGKTNEREDSDDDDGDHDFGAPPSVGGHSSDGSRPASPAPSHHAANVSLPEPHHAATPTAGGGGLIDSLSSDHHGNENIPPNEQTTLLQNEEESFALAPVDASALRGLQKTKRKRKLIVDEVKNISGEEMKAQLSDTSDIVTTLDLAPPTKRLMHWKESGGVEKLFALPDNLIPSKLLFKNYQRHLTMRMIEHEAQEHVDKHDDITLEQIRDADGEADAPSVPTPRGRPGRKRKQPEPDESLQRQQPEQSISVPDYPMAEASAGGMPGTPAPSLAPDGSGFNLSAPTPLAVAPPATPLGQQHELLSGLYNTPQQQSHDDLQADQLHSLLSSDQQHQQHHPLMENMGYDQNNPLMANMGYDEQHPPAVTPGAISDKGQATPWNDDYEFPNSAGPPEEQQTDETYEQYEERVLNKRAAHMYHILKSRLSRQNQLPFSEMVHKNNKKQVSQKFYTLLVLKKTQVLELEQEAAYEELIITRGPNFESPTL